MKMEVANLTPQIAVASKRTAVSMRNIHEAIGEMCGKLLAYLSEQGKEMSGPPYLKYTNMKPDFSEFDIEWGPGLWRVLHDQNIRGESHPHDA